MNAIIRLAFRDLQRSLARHALVAFLIFIVLSASIFINIAVSSTNNKETLRKATFGDAEYVIPLGDAYLPNDGIYDEAVYFDVPATFSAEFDGPGIDQQPARPTAKKLEELTKDLNKIGVGHTVRKIKSVYINDREYQFDTLDLSKAVEAEQIISLTGKPPKENEVVLSEDLAERLDLTIGDSFANDSNDRPVKVVGLAKDLTDSNKVYISKLDDTTFSNQVSYEEEAFFGSERLSYIEISFDDIPKVNKLLSENKYIQTYRNLKVSDVKELSPLGYFSSSGAGLLISTALVILAGLIASVSFIVSVKRREAEYLRLTTIGAKPNQIGLGVIAEVVLLTVAASIAATVFALAIAFSSASLRTKVGLDFLDGVHSAETIIITWYDIALPIILAIVFAAIAAWYPSRKVTKNAMSPIAHGISKQNPSSAKSISIGSGTIIIICLFAAPLFLFSGGLILLLPIILFGVTLIGVGIIQLFRPFFNKLPLTPRHAINSAMSNRTRFALTLSPIILILGSGLVYFQINNHYNDDSYFNEIRSSYSELDIDSLPNKGQYATKNWMQSNGTTTINGWEIINSSLKEDWIDGLPWIMVQAVNNQFESEREFVQIYIASEELLDFIGDGALKSKLIQDKYYANFHYSELEFVDQNFNITQSGIPELSDLEKISDNSLNVLFETLNAGQPGYLISEATASGLETVPFDAFEIIVLPEQLTDEQKASLFDTNYYNDFIYPTRKINTSNTNNLLWLGGLALASILIMRALIAFLAYESDKDLKIMKSVGSPHRFRRKYLAIQSFFHLNSALMLSYLFCAALFLFYASTFFIFRDGEGYEYALRNIRDEFDQISWLPILAMLLVPFIGALLTYFTTRSASPETSKRAS